jgi:hypothetical protein
MQCSACGRKIVGTPMVFGPLSLCPEGCVPTPQPDLSAQAERFAIAEARKVRRRR